MRDSDELSLSFIMEKESKKMKPINEIIQAKEYDFLNTNEHLVAI